EIIEVDEKGYVNLEKLKKSIRKDTILVSIILINNEIGTIQKVSQIGKIIKEINPETIFHVDGVQAFGKFRINVKESKIDLLSASGHKFHTPKGLGFLYIKKGLRVKPIMLGGGQQYGVRAGTENVAGAAALAHGAELAYNNFEDKINHVRMLKEKLQNGIFEIENTYLNGEVLENASPFVLNVRFEGLRSPILLNALEEKGIFVSAGSACSSKKKVQSSVLLAIGLSEEAVGSSIRFSFSSSNTVEEVEECIKALKEIVPILRRFNKKR
ncbi:MAG: cysteine desulfurase family protein, partial [Anaerotignaceae bacterium]